jgi:hypothetical protein
VNQSRTITISIARAPEVVYDFVSNPENLPRWATAFCKSVRRSGDQWIIESPDGPVKIRFVERNAFGVADHYVSPAPGVEIYVPLRVVANEQSASEVMFTLFRLPMMSDEWFQRDVEMVTRDLNQLKNVLEQHTSREGEAPDEP